jgi:hypothetical protein
MKRSLVVISIMAILMAGITWAADETSTSPAPPTPAVEQPTENPTQPPEPIVVKETVKAKMHFGPSIGIFSPTSTAVKDTFGSSWTRFGLRPFLTEVPDRWRFMFDLSYYAMDDGTDQAKLVPITAGFIRGLSQHKDMLTYMAVNMGPYYANIDAPSVPISKKGWGVNTNATFGIVFNQRWSLEARYEYMTKFAGFDFSAFSISAGLRLFDISL